MLARRLASSNKQSLHIHLIDAMGRLRQLIGGGPRIRQPLVARGRTTAGDLVAIEPGKIGDVERVIARQAEGADSVGNPELAKQLHGPGVVDVALGMPTRLGLGVEDGRSHAVHVEMQRKREADRPSADDQDIVESRRIRNGVSGRCSIHHQLIQIPPATAFSSRSPSTIPRSASHRWDHCPEARLRRARRN